jgi:uncharacterized protein
MLHCAQIYRTITRKMNTQAPYLKQQQGELFVNIHLQPKASKDAIVGKYGDRLKITITAPPIDGKANEHLIKFLSKYLGVSKKHVKITKGEHARDKTICIKLSECKHCHKLLNMNGVKDE